MKRNFVYFLSFIGLLFLLTGCSSITEDEYNDLSQRHEELQEKYVELENKYNNAIKKEEIDELNRNIEMLEETKVSLENDISDLQSEKNKLSESIIKIKGTPKTYPAGYLTVGEDIAAGRYKVYGGTSNFIVYNSYGDLRVNIILSNTYSWGVKEYIYNFINGDEVQAGSSFKLVAIE